MKKSKQHSSIQQYSNDVCDRLAALRSLLEWTIFVVLAALAATILFNLFYRIDRVDNVTIRSHSSVYVVVRKDISALEKGDTVITDADRCAVIADVTPEGLLLSEDSGKTFYTVRQNQIDGIAEIIVYPFVCSGEDVFTVTGGTRV